MPVDTLLYCPDCRMQFTTYSLLQKHRSKFCLGQSVLDAGEALRQESHRPWSTEDEAPYGRTANGSKVAELEAWKQQKVHLQNQQDARDRDLLHGLQDRASPADSWNSRASRLRGVQKQMEVGKVSPSIMHSHSQPPPQAQTHPPAPRPSVWSPGASTGSSHSSMSIHLPDDDPEEFSPRQTQEQSSRKHHLQQQAEHHSRNLRDIKSQGKSLEVQRDEIDRRLNSLNTAALWQNDATKRLIQELKDQETKTQHTLHDLKQQLGEMKQNKPRSSKSSVVAEINAMRQSYLRNGGTDPGILAQLAELEVEAMAAEGKNTGRKSKKDTYDGLLEQISAFELENQRLQKELMSLQERNSHQKRLKNNAAYEEELQQELTKRQQDHLAKLEALEKEMELARQEAKLQKLKRELAAEAETSRHPPPPPPQPVEAEMPALMQNQLYPMNMMEMEPLLPAPYDPNAGFVVFYDFVTGLDPTTSVVRLVVGLYNNSALYGEPTMLPSVYCGNAAPNSYALQQGVNMATLSARQPVPRCPPSQDLALVVEMQTSSNAMNPYNPSRLATRAWCKLDLFDLQHRLISGKWKVPLRMTPIQPSMPTLQANSIPQHGMTELYLRLVNHRDADHQSMVTMTPQNAHMYQYPPQASHLAHPVPGHYVPPLNLSPVPPSQASDYSQRTPINNRRKKSPNPNRFYDYDPSSRSIGFQVDRVKHARPGEGKVRLTAYYKGSGKIVQSSTCPVTCCTNAIKSNFKYRYHVYGRQEAVFDDVNIHHDMVLVARFYLRERAERHLQDEADEIPQDHSREDADTLVAWATLPLMVASQEYTSRTGDMNAVINIGTHVLQLYEPPVPVPEQIPLEEHWRPKEWHRYGKASLRIHIFQGRARPGSLEPSEVSEDEEEKLPDAAWIPVEKGEAATDPYSATDGFDLYIDACKNLPDSVTITRVAGRMLDRKYEKFGKDLSCTVTLDSDIYNPVYNYRVEYREPHIPPSSTLMLKIYTIGKFTKELTVVGYATLNLFVETGSQKQPSTDTGGIQVSLNEGAHQLRLYHEGPTGLSALSEASMREDGIRYIPCATLLVRLVKAPIGPQGRALEAEKVPQADWARMGLWLPRPKYSDGVYFSSTCSPTKGECMLFHTQTKRTPMSVREALSLVVSPVELAKLKADKNKLEYIRNMLTKLMDVKPLPLDLTYIAQYSPKQGIKFSLDRGQNIPWSNFTHAHFCLNPPGAFYMGQPQASYDKLRFTKRLDMNSTNKDPVWLDGFRHFPSRTYHRNLSMIIHLQEVEIEVAADSYKYTLLQQAWTAVQVFKDGYANTAVFKLPLYEGSPTVPMLNQLAHEPCLDWCQRNLETGTIKLADNACIYIRLCDGRRDEELPDDLANLRQDDINQDYLPQNRQRDYEMGAPEGQLLAHMVPQGKTVAQFVKALAIKFKSLVYKLYEENLVTNS